MDRWLAAARSAIVSVLVVASFAPPATAQEKPLTKVIFSLDFIPLGRHAPWYAALAQGYFKEEGLDVSIIPSQGTAQTIQAVESGIANMAFVDVPSVVLARAGGSKLRMVAVNYQKAPYAIFSLSNGANVTQPKQLEGLTLGSGAGSFTPKVIEGFMAQKGLDPSKLKITNVAPPARATMLLSGQVPAIEFFVMAKPGLEAGAKDAKTELRTFLLSDQGLDLYSNGIAVTEDYLARNPEVVRGFVRAGLKGWKFALANPQKAAEDEIKSIASLKPEIIVAEIGIVRDLAVTSDVKQHGLGWFDAAKMKSAVDFVTKHVGMTGTPPAAADVYATGFLPSPGITP
jgi:NitT/TauT family transport system substrate-binding protein